MGSVMRCRWISSIAGRVMDVDPLGNPKDALPITVRALTRSQPIPDAEWVISVQLEIGGRPFGPVHDYRYADSHLAKHPADVGYLLGKALAELAIRASRVVKPRAKRASSRRR